MVERKEGEYLKWLSTLLILDVLKISILYVNFVTLDLTMQKFHFQVKVMLRCDDEIGK